jgi:hypothetical protein
MKFETVAAICARWQKEHKPMSTDPLKDKLQRRYKWEPVCSSSALQDKNAGDYRISVWRLPIEGGWLYKLRNGLTTIATSASALCRGSATNNHQAPS